MGKNKKRNRKNKKNHQILDKEKDGSSSANMNRTEVNETNKRSNLKTESCSNHNCITSLDLKTMMGNNFKIDNPSFVFYDEEYDDDSDRFTDEMQNYTGSFYGEELGLESEPLKPYIKENFTSLETKTMQNNLSKKDWLLFEDSEDENDRENFMKYMENYMMEGDSEEEGEPLDGILKYYDVENEYWVENGEYIATALGNYSSDYYEAKHFIENEYRVENKQALVKAKTSTFSMMHDNTNSYEGGLTKSHSDSVPTSKSTGAIPKRNSQFGNSITLEGEPGHFELKQDEKNLQLLSQNIKGSITKYEYNWESFKRLYLTWKKQREITIMELKKLVEKVHAHQKKFNQGNLFFKQLNVASREIKSCNQSSAVDYLTSLASFVTDAASGITSMVQACNIDIHTTEFKRIMDLDAKLTKPLHQARSQCFEEYRNVEEMIRECHLKTFGNTINDISNTLRVNDLVSQITKAFKGDDCLGEIIASANSFIKRNANFQVMSEIKDSFQLFLDSNPAAVDACKSGGKTLYGAYDAWLRDFKQSRASIQGNMSLISNQLVLVEQRRELEKLRAIVDYDQGQSKLELEIQHAISMFVIELGEMNEIFEKYNRKYGDNWCCLILIFIVLFLLYNSWYFLTFIVLIIFFLCFLYFE